DGVDLGRLVAMSGPLPIPQASDYIRQAALGLQHAHEHGLVHRDIKPSNLLITADDSVKILDLGLARLGPAEPLEATAEAEHLNGTPDFMPPEVACDPRAADIRSDLYSLGCTFYFLLTGQVPYPGGNWTEKL